MNNIIELDYPTFLKTIRDFNMKTRFLEKSSSYILKAWDEVFQLQTTISKGRVEESHFKRHYKDNFNSVDQNISDAFNTTQTNTVLWDTTSGKRFVVKSIIVNLRNRTLSDQTIQIFDETNSGNTRLLNVSLAPADLQTIVVNDEYISQTPGNRLIVTTSGAMIVNIKVKVYEVF